MHTIKTRPRPHPDQHRGSGQHGASHDHRHRHQGELTKAATVITAGDTLTMQGDKLLGLPKSD